MPVSISSCKSRVYAVNPIRCIVLPRRNPYFSPRRGACQAVRTEEIIESDMLYSGETFYDIIGVVRNLAWHLPPIPCSRMARVVRLFASSCRHLMQKERR